MGKFNLNCIRVGMIQTNCYIAHDEDVKEAIIVDPGDNAAFITTCLDNLQVKPVAILLTHAHMDHILAVPDLKSKYHIPLYVSEADKPMLEDGSLNLGGISVQTDETDVFLKGGETLNIGGMEIQVIATPGHTPGGTCYYFEKESTLLSGDTMFRCSWGRTDFPGGDAAALMKSIREKLLPLPEETKVFPGHESPTTIETERRMHGYL